MSSRTTKFYSFERNQLIINGIRIGGFGTEGGMEYEYDSQLFEMAVGADGEVTASHLVNDLLRVTITIMETSDAYPLLANLAEAQKIAARTGTGALLPISYLHFDPAVGDTVVTGNAIVLDRFTPSKGRVAGERSMVLALPYGALKPLFDTAFVLPTVPGFTFPTP